MREPFRKASVVVAILLVLEVLVGLAILIVTAIYQVILGNYLAETERKMLQNSLINVYLFGIQLMVLFLCSLTMWNRIWPRRCTPNIHMLLLMWLFFCLLIIFSGFATVWSLFRGSCVLEGSAESSLLRGIDLYYSYPEWKLLWDSLQLHKQCCGVHSYMDWMNAEWLPKPEDNCALGPGAVLAPHTCCKRTCTSCFQQSISGSGSNNGGSNVIGASGFPKLSIEYINKEGCLPVFTDTMWRFLYILLVLVVLSLKFVIILCCLTKYIIYKQSSGDSCNAGFTDDEGRPLVVVKYPANVRCITLGEDDLASDIAPCDVNYCTCGEPDDQCCCNEYYEGN